MINFSPNKDLIVFASDQGSGVGREPPLRVQQHRVVRLLSLNPFLMSARGAAQKAGASTIIASVEQIVPQLDEESSVNGSNKS